MTMHYAAVRHLFARTSSSTSMLLHDGKFADDVVSFASIRDEAKAMYELFVESWFFIRSFSKYDHNCYFGYVSTPLVTLMSPREVLLRPELSVNCILPCFVMTLCPPRTKIYICCVITVIW